MWLSLPLFPEQASTVAGRVDALYFFLLGVSTIFAVLIFVLVIFFAVRYRRSKHPRARQIGGSLPLEILWSAIPFSLAMVMFAWGANLYYDMYEPPKEAADLYVVAKQWMWKFQHPEGPSEINELHIPVGRRFKTIMTSQDVIHSLYIPAFRIKRDVLPGRYVSAWFEATQPGEYHLFCAEYCGTEHSRMVGRVVVMAPAEYEKWLTRGSTGVSMAAAGRQLFEQLGCRTCHSRDSGANGPQLAGRFGSRVQLRSGQTIVMDENYLRKSILDPAFDIAAGYDPTMPTYRGLVSEEGLMQIVEWLKRSDEAAATQPAQQP